MNKIVYHNFAPKAAENALFSSDSDSFDYTVSLIEESEPVNFASLENTGIDLIDESLVFGQETDNVGFVSSEVSSSARIFPNGGIRLIFAFDKKYSGPGITLHFHQNYCTKVKVEFYSDSDLLFDNLFMPDSLDFYCEAPAKLYNKLILTFTESEIPNQFVKLRSLDFGKVQEISTFFGAINIFEEIRADCSDLPCDSCDFEAIVPKDITPQVGQYFFVYHGEKCFGKFTTDKLTEDVARRFIFESSCDKNVLGNSPFPALSRGTYTVDDILSKIYENSDISINNGGFGDTELTGFVKSNSNSRYAAAMLSMGSGFFISSARNRKLRLFRFRDRGSYTISADRIFGRAEYIKKAPYTSINLYKHSGSDFDNDSATVYKAENEKITANIAVNELNLDKYSLFSDPSARLEEIKALGFERNEIRAEIILEDEQVGDILNIDTPHGIKKGIIESLDISLRGSETIANAVLIETEVN
ncbi:MAG: hypothetical protein IKJ41_07945 [Clostridia bacterium]|nr:hypothetical protein [Clostridia bacterium]